MPLQAEQQAAISAALKAGQADVLDEQQKRRDDDYGQVELERELGVELLGVLAPAAGGHVQADK